MSPRLYQSGCRKAADPRAKSLIRSRLGVTQRQESYYKGTAGVMGQKKLFSNPSVQPSSKPKISLTFFFHGDA